MITNGAISKQRELLAEIPKTLAAKKRSYAHAEEKKKEAIRNEEWIMKSRMEVYKAVTRAESGLERAISRSSAVQIGAFAVFAENELEILLDKIEELEMYIDRMTTVDKKDALKLERKVLNLDTILGECNRTINWKIELFKKKIESKRKKIEVQSNRRDELVMYIKYLPGLLIFLSTLIMMIMGTPLAKTGEWIYYPDSGVFSIYVLGCLFTIVILIDHFKDKNL